MTTDEAIEFLRQNQPLPPTEEDSSAEALRRFDEVRQHFLGHPDNRCVPLILNAFGEGDGNGVYQLVEDTIAAHDESVVIAALLDSLRNCSGWVRYWSAQIAADYPQPELVAPLADILRSGTSDERSAAVMALRFNGSREARIELERALASELDEDVKKDIRDA